VVFLSLAFVHPLLELLIVTFAPALIAWAFAAGSRSFYLWNARVAAVVSGVAGGCWLLATSETGENVPAVLIGAIVAVVLMLGLAWLGAFLLDQALTRRASWRD
jgi:hypothetical protein